MTPRVRPGALKKTNAWEFIVRFALGGAITAATGVVAHAYGPSVGGLFLAFPAILPASLTLVTEHDGRREATDDARGACLGTLGLLAFATVVWLTGSRWPAAVVLALATVAWSITCGAAWLLVYATDGPSRAIGLDSASVGRRRLSRRGTRSARASDRTATPRW